MAGILRGDIHWAELNPVRGREQAGMRPVLVLSADVFNERSEFPKEPAKQPGVALGSHGGPPSRRIALPRHGFPPLRAAGNGVEAAASA
ncbi:MAG: type II toxin-antitoxin system PemK/MazF family toxin [Deltaproteobacteria bacterium]|nr:type II toxin-antitoxin system PemK/MazF family toxin [Deltaproteobacteria bacterium]